MPAPSVRWAANALLHYGQNPKSYSLQRIATILAEALNAIQDNIDQLDLLTGANTSSSGGSAANALWTLAFGFLYPTDLTNRVLVGMTSSDLGAGSLITADYIACVSAPTNASTMVMQMVANNYGTIGTNATGTGIQLPLTFFTQGIEWMRILTNGKVLIGRTIDDGSGARLQVAGGISSNGTLLTVP